SVRRNVEYGLRMRRLPRQARAERVARVLATLGLEGLADRYPDQLSGGQQQRVALGRVMALEPQVLLLDEPLSNLDAQLRVRLRVGASRGGCWAWSPCALATPRESAAAAGAARLGARTAPRPDGRISRLARGGGAPLAASAAASQKQ